MDDRTQVMSARPLPMGHELHWYSLEGVLGQGGFGITYLGNDNNLNRQVAVKEYLPSVFAYRNTDFTVNPVTGDHAKNYSWGLGSFLNEARTLAKFRHRNIVQVLAVFEENNTAYMVMEYEHGDSLSEVFKKRSKDLDQQFYEQLLFPVMQGLHHIHDAGFIHRDIKPANLYLRDDGSPVLIDFGSARQTSQQDTGEMTALVSQGYTPLEQYSSNFGSQGPWTDIYSFAASVYHGITGSRAVDALNRSAAALGGEPDPLKKLTDLQPEGYTAHFLQAIDSGLCLKPADRPQSLSQWKGIFEGVSVDDATVFMAHRDVLPEADSVASYAVHDQLQLPDEPAAPDQTTVDVATPVNKKTSATPIYAGVLLLALCAGAGWWYLQTDDKTGFEINSELVNALPTPAVAFKVRTPVKRLEGEFKDLQSLALVYAQALKISANNPLALEGMKYVSDSYAALAQFQLVRGNNKLRQQLTTAMQSMDSEDAGIAEVLESLKKPTKTSVQDIEVLLDSTRLDADMREQLVFSLASLSDQDRELLAGDVRVGRLSRQFKESIVAALRNSEFDLAVHMIEMALMLEPEDNGLHLLKGHIEKTGGA